LATTVVLLSYFFGEKVFACDFVFNFVYAGQANVLLGFFFGGELSTGQRKWYPRSPNPRPISGPLQNSCETLENLLYFICYVRKYFCRSFGPRL